MRWLLTDSGDILIWNNENSLKKSGEKTVCELNSWSTGEEFCKVALEKRGISETNGWTLALNEDNDFYELMGYDYVFDLVSEMEIAPAFPVCKSFFLVTSDQKGASVSNKRRQSLAAR